MVSGSSRSRKIAVVGTLLAALTPVLALRWLDPVGLQTTVASSAEVVAAVLAIVITVVAIVVELAANRYTPRITHLFVRNPVNIAVASYFVLTTLACLWVSAYLDVDAVEQPVVGAYVVMAMVTGAFVVLLPYFAFVFGFLQPVSVVNRIGAEALRCVRKATGPRPYDQTLREQAVTGVEQLEDVALSALGHRDRVIAVAAIEALEEWVGGYQTLRGQLAEDWFKIGGELAHDPDFVALARSERRDLEARHLWAEMKVLRQYYTIYTAALNRVHDVARTVAMSTQRIAVAALAAGQLALLDLCTRILNSYLRAGINGRDMRTAYYVAHQYRKLAQQALAADEVERGVRMACHLRFYGQMALGLEQPFLLEVVAYDLSLLTEWAFDEEHAARDELLEVMLSVDKEDDSPDEPLTPRGVRRVQAQLGTFFLARGDLPNARRLFDDMAAERPERLASIRDELLADQSPSYWEVTDRGTNFSYLPPERKAQVDTFFRWFGSRLRPTAAADSS